MKTKLLLFLILFIGNFTVQNPVQAEEALPRFEPGDCLIKVPDDVAITCGTLVTLEDYENPAGNTVRLPVIIIHNRDGNPDADAILFTEGGPAFSSLNSVWWLSGADFSQTHDIVILEQRGNPYAEPSLDCDITVLWEESVENTTCLESLLDQGIDLSQYTTANIATDIDTLRLALDYDVWNLLGTSYSTRPMQLVLARNPEDIRSVVFNSVAPMTSTRFEHDPEHSARAIQVMLDDCAADPACSAAYPDLEEQLYAVIAELNAHPVSFEMTFPGTDVRFVDEVDGNILIGWMVGDAFYDPAYHPYTTAYLPLLISELYAGNTDLLYAWRVEDLASTVKGNFAWGLYFTINCQDFAPASSIEAMQVQAAADPELDGYSRHMGELEICDAWGLHSSNGILAEPIATDIPTLVFSGNYDPITPGQWSKTALVNFSNLTLVEVPSAGHSVLSAGRCPVSLVTAFFDDPEADLDLSCLSDITPPTYVLPEEIIIDPAIYEVHWNELGASMLEENLFLGSLIAQVGCAALILISGFVNYLRHKKLYQRGKASKATQPLAVSLGLFSLFWAYGLRFLLNNVANAAPIILRFGMPAVTWQIFVMAILIGILSVILLVLVILSWRRGYWSLYRRILVSVSALAALTFSGMLAYWGFFTALFSLI
jgi:pimeloyl-ACP methyl ester carboxylesterase